MRRKLIAGNWKMNSSQAAVRRFFDDFQLLNHQENVDCDFLICPPFVYLTQCAEEILKIGGSLGAQDLSVFEKGAYTGDVSGAMLADLGCRYVIVGHSERRQYHNETDEIVCKKTIQALCAGITPIICVGESLEQHLSGDAIPIVIGQLKAVLDQMDTDSIAKIIVSYEPLWAIGSGMVASPEIAQAVHVELRRLIASRDLSAGQTVKILYGGSMKPDNAKSLLMMPDIDGGLIGGASLNAADFSAIIHSVSNVCQ